MLSDIIGNTVKNDGESLKRILEIYLPFNSFHHAGDYVFNAVLPKGKLAVITTVPVDEQDEEIRILSVNIRAK